MSVAAVDMADDHAADTMKFKEPVGRSAKAALGSPVGKAMVYGLAILWTIPTFGILVSSFRPELEVKTSGWWKWFADPSITFDNYRRVFSSKTGDDNMWKFFLNSMKITLPSVFLSVGLALLAAYAFSWMKFKGRDWLFVAVVSLLMVPLQMALIPMLQLFSGGAHIGSVTIFPDLGLTQNVIGVWIAHTAFGMPFCIFILTNFVSALPKEVIEAARVDGAGHLTVFRKLIIPLSVPAIASLAIFQFMWIWNDYLIALDLRRPRQLPAHCSVEDADRYPRPVVAPVDCRRHRLDGSADLGVLRPAALLRARLARRGGEGLVHSVPHRARGWRCPQRSLRHRLGPM